MKESAVEGVLVDEVHKAGGIALKIMPTHAGAPDRLVIMPAGRAFLVELKTTTGRVAPIQEVMHARLMALGHPVVVLHGAEEVRTYVRSLT